MCNPIRCAQHRIPSFENRKVWGSLGCWKHEETKNKGWPVPVNLWRVSEQPHGRLWKESCSCSRNSDNRGFNNRL